MALSLIAALLVLGAFTGFAAGLLGIGGGMLMVPFMSMVLDAVGVPHDEVVKVAIATSLTTIVFTSASSVRARAMPTAVPPRFDGDCLARRSSAARAARRTASGGV